MIGYKADGFYMGFLPNPNGKGGTYVPFTNKREYEAVYKRLKELRES